MQFVINVLFYYIHEIETSISDNFTDIYNRYSWDYILLCHQLYNYNKKECPYFGSNKRTCFEFTGGAVSIIAQ